MLVGEVCIYVVGVPWLAIDLHVGLAKAIALGFTPFVIGDAIKLGLAAGLLPTRGGSQRAKIGPSNS